MAQSFPEWKHWPSYLKIIAWFCDFYICSEIKNYCCPWHTHPWCPLSFSIIWMIHLSFQHSNTFQSKHIQTRLSKFLIMKLGVTALTWVTRLGGQRDIQGNRLHWALLGCSGHSGLNLAVLNCDWLYWAVLGCTGSFWATLGCRGMYSGEGCTGLYWTLLCGTWQ